MSVVPRPLGREETGLRAVIAYKYVKGAVQLVLAAAATTLLLAGFGQTFMDWAAEFRLHASRAWSTAAARFLVSLSAPHRMVLSCVALWLDGGVTLLEGVALHERWWWGPWLVVVLSGSLLPFEVRAFLRHPRALRALVFLVNLAIVLFLARHALRGRRRSRQDGALGA